MNEDNIKRRVIKIGMLGDSAVGKTAICQTYMNIEFNGEVLSTIGVEKLESVVKLKNGKEIKLIIWDTAGQERFHSIALKSIKTVHGVAIVFDLTKKQSFDNINSWLDDINENLNDVCIVIFGNKCDLDKKTWKVKNDEIKKFIEQKKLKYFETSAKDNIGIKEGFESLANDAYDKWEESSGIKLSKNSKKKGSCCSGGNGKSKKNKKK